MLLEGDAEKRGGAARGRPASSQRESAEGPGTTAATTPASAELLASGEARNLPSSRSDRAIHFWLAAN